MNLISENFTVPIGIGNRDKKVFLDLSDAEGRQVDGPHMLVTGSTGLGKTELLLSFLLTACLKYPPEMFQFVIIDFKNGSLSNKVNDFPHCAGEFTNKFEVTERSVYRILTMLEEEIAKRLKLISAYNIEKISQYHRLWAKNPQMPKMPILSVVVDELAVFFDKNKNGASIISKILSLGRSAGIYVFAGTQNQSVLTPQMKTNINACITFDETHKGRVFISSKAKHNVVCQVAYANKSVSGQKTEFDIFSDEIKVRYGHYAQQNKVLLPEIETFCQSIDFPTDYPCCNVAENEVLLGIKDDIYKQSQSPLHFPFLAHNTLICGGMKSGKTTLIKTIIRSICNGSCGYKPDKISLYVVAKNPLEYEEMDYPQIGSILPESSFYYGILFLKREIAKRQKIANPKPMVFFFDDSCDSCFSLLSGSKDFVGILQMASSVNIAVVCAVSSIKNLGMDKVLPFFKSRISFFIDEKFNYGTVLNRQLPFGLPNIQGRCLVDLPEETSVFEAQILDSGDNKTLAQQARIKWARTGKARPGTVPIMPREFKVPKAKMNKMPVGLDMDLNFHFWNFLEDKLYGISVLSLKDFEVYSSYMLAFFEIQNYKTLVLENTDVALAKLAEVAVNEPTFILIPSLFNVLNQKLNEKSVGQCLRDLLKGDGKVVIASADTPSRFLSTQVKAERLPRDIKECGVGALIGKTPREHELKATALEQQQQISSLPVGTIVHFDNWEATFVKYPVGLE